MDLLTVLLQIKTTKLPENPFFFMAGLSSREEDVFKSLEKLRNIKKQVMLPGDKRLPLVPG